MLITDRPEQTHLSRISFKYCDGFDLQLTPPAHEPWDRDRLVIGYWQTHPRICFFLNTPPHGSLLDMGCGSGGLAHARTVYTPKREDIRMLGCDIETGTHQHLYERVCIGDFDKVDFDFPSNSVDSVLASHFFEHIENKQKYFSETLRIMKPGAQMYIEIPSIHTKVLPDASLLRAQGLPVIASNFFEDHTHIETYSPDALRSLCEEGGFRVIAAGYVTSPAYEDDLLYYGYKNNDQETAVYGLWSKMLWAHYIVVRKPNSFDLAFTRHLLMTQSHPDRFSSKSELPSASQDEKTVQESVPPSSKGELTKDASMSARSAEIAQLSDPEFYITQGAFEEASLFSPWLGFGEYGVMREQSKSQAPRGRLYFIHELMVQSLACAREKGEVWECGVYRGESALFLGAVARRHEAKLRLFDTFAGMPETRGDKDFHRSGDFSDTSLEFVRSRFTSLPGLDVEFHPGIIPASLAGREQDPIAFAHIDLDIFDAILSALDFIFPRLLVGGAVVFDDYAWASCPGARAAVDSYFAGRRERVLVLPTGQAFVVRLY
jgi:O-methyltransferase